LRQGNPYSDSKTKYYTRDQERWAIYQKTRWAVAPGGLFLIPIGLRKVEAGSVGISENSTGATTQRVF
jgi:hypothetical protein